MLDRTVRFITLEGVDGSGKSTQVRRLGKALVKDSSFVTTTHEPGGSPGAEDVRRLLVEGDPERWSPETEVLLHTAARRDHVERTVRPALESGNIVISDRYVDSTRAYQGMVPGNPKLLDQINWIHEKMIGLNPDRTIILDFDPLVAFKRARARGSSEDRMEQRGYEFQVALRKAYQKIAQTYPERCRVVDADGTEHEVHKRILEALSS